MAIGLWLKFTDGTQAQYEAVNSQMGIDDDPPEGLIFHSAGPMGQDWSVMDFWESRDHFDRFLEGRLGQAIEALGDQALPGPPDIKEFQVSNIIEP